MKRWVVELLLLLLVTGFTGLASGGRAPAPAAGLRFVDQNGAPLSGAPLRIQCYDQPSGGTPFADLLAQTDAAGELSAPLPPGCAYLAALRAVYSQPSAKAGHPAAYEVYNPSWPAGTAAPQAASGDITIDTRRSLVLFNLVASLEWQPEPGSPLPARLRQGLRAASAYLYSLSGGQMAFGQLSIFSGGQNWDAADLRFLAADDYRPSALIGGIVPGATAYTTPAGVQVTYTPGDILLGRFWDGKDASDPVGGSWAEPPGWRTLVHEWAHYALFLYDEYQTQSATSTYCTCTDLPQVGRTSNPLVCSGATQSLAASAMAYQYTAGQFWLQDASTLPPPACLGTDQLTVQGEADWSTLARWPDIQGLAGSWIAAPPALALGPTPGLTGGFFDSQPGQRFYLPLVSALPGTAASLSLSLELATPPPGQTQADLDALTPQVYLLETQPAAPPRILFQGTTTGPHPLPGGLGAIDLFGVQPGGRARIYADQYTPPGSLTPGGRFIYPAPGAADPPLAPGQTLGLVSDPWLASLDLQYTLQGHTLTGLSLTLSGPSGLPALPVARLCSPDSAAGCAAAWQAQMQPAGANRWQVSFTAPAGGELPGHGVVWVSTQLGELARWYQVAGGVGPAHVDGHTGIADGPASLRALPSALGTGDYAFMPAASAAALLAPLPPGMHGILGVPLDFDVSGADNHHLGAPLIVTLAFSQQAVARLGVSPGSLHLIHFSSLTNTWQDVSNPSDLAKNPDLDWISSLPVTEDGIYAVAF